MNPSNAMVYESVEKGLGQVSIVNLHGKIVVLWDFNGRCGSKFFKFREADAAWRAYEAKLITLRKRW